jgi:hypothetical protein
LGSRGQCNTLMFWSVDDGSHGACGAAVVLVEDS